MLNLLFLENYGWGVLLALLLLGTLILFAAEHRKNATKRNLNKHQKGQKRKRQKNLDKKRNKDQWKSNNNKK